MNDVRLFEVCLRDGLQNEEVVLSTEKKVAIATALVAAGFCDIEITSFVRPRWVPQLADAADVVRQLPVVEGVRYWALVPNVVGLDRALESGIRHIATFLSSSETHNRKNVNRTIKESLAGLHKVIPQAKSEGLAVRAYVSTVFGCPFEGAIAVDRVLAIAMDLLSEGADTVALGDTTGMAHPAQVEAILGRFVDEGIGLEHIALHFHDTRGTAVANVAAAHRFGARQFDASVSGVGGCPYAPGAAGNATTQDLVHFFERLSGEQEVPEGFGSVTGIDLDAVCHIGLDLERALGRPLTGRYHEFWKGHRALEQRSASGW